MNTYEVRFSVFGANALPMWRRSIASVIRVQAVSEDAALDAAKVELPSLTDADILSVGQAVMA